MNSTKKELTKSLKWWQKEKARLEQVVTSKTEKNSTFVVKHLKIMVKEAEEIIVLLEKQLGVSDEK